MDLGKPPSPPRTPLRKTSRIAVLPPNFWQLLLNLIYPVRSGLATDDKEGRLRRVLWHGHKLSTHDRIPSATLQQWYDASSPSYHRALRDAETARDEARMSWHQNAIRRYQPIPFFLAYADVWRTQKQRTDIIRRSLEHCRKP